MSSRPATAPMSDAMTSGYSTSQTRRIRSKSVATRPRAECGASATKDGLVYAACLGAGVCILETTSTGGVTEVSPVLPVRPAFEPAPNPASSFVNIREEVSQSTSKRSMVRFFNAAGRVVLDVPIVLDRGKQPRPQRVDISALPDGCYFVAVEPSGQGRVQKVIKAGKRK